MDFSYEELFKDKIFENMKDDAMLWVAMADHYHVSRKKLIRKMLAMQKKCAMILADETDHVDMVVVDKEEMEKQMEELDG